MALDFKFTLSAAADGIQQCPHQSVYVACLLKPFQWPLWSEGQVLAPEASPSGLGTRASSTTGTLCPPAHLSHQPVACTHDILTVRALVPSCPFIWKAPSAPNLTLCGLHLLILKGSTWAAPSPQELFPTSWSPSFLAFPSPGWVRGPLPRLWSLYNTYSIRLFFSFTFSFSGGRAISYPSLDPQSQLQSPHFFPPTLYQALNTFVHPFPLTMAGLTAWRCGRAEDILPSSFQQRGSGVIRQSLPRWLGWNFLLGGSDTVLPPMGATASQRLWGTLTVLG